MVLGGFTWERFMDILPLLALMVGVIAGLAGDVLRSRLTETGRQRSERESFDRSTLVQLHDEVNTLCSLAQDVAEERLGAGVVTPSMATENHRTRLHIQVLALRLDDDLLSKVEDVAQAAWALHHGSAASDEPSLSELSESELEKRFLYLVEVVDREISGRLRKLSGRS